MSDKGCINKIKKRIIEDLLSKGDAMICLDARHNNVCVPNEHKNNPCLNLIVNLSFRKPIKLTDDHISAILSFGVFQKYYNCIIPYESIWAAYHPHSKKGMMWPESIPADALHNHTRVANKKATFEANVNLNKQKPRLPSKKKSFGGSAHLRLIK